MRQYIVIFLSIFSLFWLNSSQAERVHGLNTVSVTVNQRTPAALQQALPQAMTRALIKISGNPQIATLPDIQNALANANNLVRSYGFYQRDSRTGGKQLALKITFDRAGLDRVLYTAHQPIWHDYRPLLLIWLSIKTPQTNFVLSSSGNAFIRFDVTQAAKQRGLPFILPVMDLQDEGFINDNPAMAFNSVKLTAAAQRYAVNDVLAGNLTENADGIWQGQWLLRIKGQPFRWNNDGNSDQAVVDAGINKATNILANQYAIVDNHNLQSTVILEIFGVNSLASYANLMKTLKQLPIVASVNLQDMQSVNVIVQVKTVGGKNALAEALNANHHFQTRLQPPTQHLQTNHLYYQWQTE